MGVEYYLYCDEKKEVYELGKNLFPKKLCEISKNLDLIREYINQSTKDWAVDNLYRNWLATDIHYKIREWDIVKETSDHDDFLFENIGSYILIGSRYTSPTILKNLGYVLKWW